MFKVNNLVVSLIPGAHLDPKACAQCSVDTRCNGCTNQDSQCPGGCSNRRSDYSEHCPPKFVDPAEYAKLEALLEQALTQVRARQRYADALRPRSKKELETLVARLKVTLKEVEGLKAEVGHETAVLSPHAGMFQVRDLLISVLKPPAGADSGCPGCTCAAGCSGPTGCTNASTKVDFDPIEERELAELTALLDHATIALGTPGGGRKPQTEAEIEAVRGALVEALAQLERAGKLVPPA